MKIPQISGKIAIKVFEKFGYRVARQRGSHIRMHHYSNSKKPITVPDHKVIGKGLLRKLLRDTEIELEKFLENLRK